MKKTVKMLALATFAMMVAVACNNAPEVTEEDTIIDTPAVEAVVEDTTPAVDTVVAEPVAAKPAKKPAKQEVKKTSAADQNLNNAGTSQTGSFGAANNSNTKKSDGNNAASQSLDNANNNATGTFGAKKN